MMPRFVRRPRWRSAGVVPAAALLTVALATTASAVGFGETPFQATLRASVENGNGEPRINPASAQQTSLAEAAAGRNGAGARTEKLARGVAMGKIQRPPNLPNPNVTGSISSGCLIDYGKPGAQCLPARARGGAAVTCAYVVSLFPKGIAVSGRDRLGLDSNRDGIACGPGDRGVS